MADLATSIATARKAGYSDADITAYIAKDPAYGPKVAEARKAGYSDTEIVSHLSPKNQGKDAAKAFGSGLVRGAIGLVDSASSVGPIGLVRDAQKVARYAADKMGLVGPQDPIAIGGAAARNKLYQPQGWGEEALQTLGENAVNALAPGGVVRRAANVVLPTIGAEAAGKLARAAGAGPTGETAARTAGGIVGGGVSSVSRAPRLPARLTPVETLGARARQDPAAMRARAAEMRAAGVEPTLTDVVDDAGRGGIRAAANRQTPGRQVANDFSRNRTANLPDRISTQTRRTVSNDPRSPDQIRTEMADRRSANADRAFGAVRGDAVNLAPEGVQALRTDYGRAAIREAARRERDPQTRAALNRLSEDALDNPSTPITVGMADRVSRVLLGQAQEAARRGDNDLATTLGGLGRSVRAPTAQASAGYRRALAGYGADTRLQQAAGTGENFMRPNTDEFVAEAGRLNPQERNLALAAGRRAVERAVGENPSSAPGVARRLADAPEQQTRNNALMGPQRAQQFQNAMREEARAVENANAIAPRTGSSTFLNAADDGSMVRQAAGGLGDLARGRWGALGMRIYDAWRTRGMNDQQIEQLVRVATDPAQTDAAINEIAARLAPAQRQEFLSLRNAALVGGLSAASAVGASAAPQ